MASGSQRTGRLEEQSVPEILIQLHREGFSGQLRLDPGHVKRKIRFNEGFPVAFESANSSHSLLRYLEKKGELGPADLDPVRGLIRQHGNREPPALFRLGVLEPGRLLDQIRSHTWNQLEECFVWHRGTWQLDADRASDPALRPLHSDPYPQIQLLLARHWGLDRILQDLAPHGDSFAATNLSFTGLAMRLERDGTTKTLFAQLDGSHTLGNLLGAIRHSALAVSTLWLLDRTGCLRFGDRPEHSSPFFAPESREIEISRSPEDTGAASVNSAESEPHSGPTPEELSNETARLHAEIQERIASSEDENHYEILGVERTDGRMAIKKAYLQAAKRYHPDAIGRHGLASMAQPTTLLFSRIALAWETLRDTAKRSKYDQLLDADSENMDVDRIRRAETCYRKGEILLRKGDFAAAERFLEPAVGLWPSEAAYRSALAWTLYKKMPSEPKRALKHLERALASKPDDAITHFRAGIVQRALGDTENAARSLARARELDPKESYAGIR